MHFTGRTWRPPYEAHSVIIQAIWPDASFSLLILPPTLKKQANKYFDIFCYILSCNTVNQCMTNLFILCHCAALPFLAFVVGFTFNTPFDISPVTQYIFT